MFPVRNQLVTVVDNEAGKEWTGRIKIYTRHRITIEQEKPEGWKRELHFNAKEVHFKKH